MLGIFKFQLCICCEIAKTKFHLVSFFLLTLYYTILIYNSKLSHKRVDKTLQVRVGAWVEISIWAGTSKHVGTSFLPQVTCIW